MDFPFPGRFHLPRKVISGTSRPVESISEVENEVARAQSGEIDAAKPKAFSSFTLLYTPARSGNFGVARALLLTHARVAANTRTHEYTNVLV